MALEKTLAAAAALQTAATALIAKAASDEAALAQAQTDLANADDQASAAIQPITDAINAALPQPAPVAELPSDQPAS